MRPKVSGYCSSTPKLSTLAASASSPTCSSMPSPPARVRSTSSVCGCMLFETKNTLDFDRDERLARVIASAAAVASSSSEALAISMPVRSATMVWKLIRSEEHTSELQSLMRNSYAVFCLKKKKQKQHKSRLHYQ